MADPLAKMVLVRAISIIDELWIILFIRRFRPRDNLQDYIEIESSEVKIEKEILSSHFDELQPGV